MQFSARTGNFAQSAQAVTRDFEKSLDVARRYSPKADEMVIAAANIKSKEKIAATKIKGEITSRGIRAAAAVKSDKLDQEGKATLRKSKRKAGVLAAGGQLVADGANKLFQEERTKRTVGEGAEGYTSLIEQSRKKAEELRRQAGEVDLTGGYKPMEVPSASDSSTSDSGGVTSTGDSSTSDSGGVTSETTVPTGSDNTGEGTTTDTGAYTPPKAGKQFTKSELEQLAIKGGFSSSEAPLVARIAMGESSGNSMAFNGKGNDQSYGLMQINMLGDMGPERRRQFGLKSNDQLYDPLTNMQAAYKIYQQQGWKAWGAYTNGSYQKY